MDDDEKAELLTPLYLIEYQNGQASEQVIKMLEKWGLIKRVTKRCTKAYNLTSKGLFKCLENSIVLEEDSHSRQKGGSNG